MRMKIPDRKNALSMISAAEGDMRFTLSLAYSPEAGSTIVRNIYESFRMLGDAIMVSKGLESTDHIAPIKELTSLDIKTDRPLMVLDNLRRLRHNINYYGYKPGEMEVKDAVLIAKKLFKPIVRKLKGDLNAEEIQR